VLVGLRYIRNKTTSQVITSATLPSTRQLDDQYHHFWCKSN
jgi:hypothetical protein